MTHRNKRLIEIILLVSISGLIIYIAATFLRPKKILSDDNYLPEPRIEFGIVVGSFQVYKNEIQEGENLSSILGRFHVEGSAIDKLEKASDSVFDIRKIRAGNRYTVLCTNDNLKKALYFIYEPTDTSYVVFNFKDSVQVYEGQKQVTVKKQYAAGTIKGSLWNTFGSLKIDPNLAISLSEIFQWTIDFYAIQEGDQFKVSYDQLYVGNKSIGLGRIHSAWFYHNGKPYYAFKYNDNGTTGYYDENGNSLKRGFLKAPLKFSRITSRFTNARFHPVLRIWRPHHGVDYAAPRGTPVHAIGNGSVLQAGFSGGGGKTIRLKHTAAFETSYMHLSSFAAGIRKGVHVNQGQVIGYVGSSGLATGPHLDFRIYRGGIAVDPLKMISPPGIPVSKQNLAIYTRQVLSEKAKLAAMKI
ncbi:MAG: peptidoglycan DD-metalloendopeptidase family protein [Bacteroidota bacterium]|nr:peptidoglycan DD-metalloendopeptidase family protein [Bacteroidota bacterium]